MDTICSRFHQSMVFIWDNLSYRHSAEFSDSKCTSIRFLAYPRISSLGPSRGLSGSYFGWMCRCASFCWRIVHCSTCHTFVYRNQSAHPSHIEYTLFQSKKAFQQNIFRIIDLWLFHQFTFECLGMILY